MKKLLTLITVFASLTMWAQTQVSGTVTDADGQPLPGANIVLDGSTGTVSDFDGNFSLSTDQQPPFSLNISSVGFESATVEVTSASVSYAVAAGVTAMIGYTSMEASDEGAATDDGSAWYIGANMAF